MSKRKILVFIDWFLPGYKAGGPITSCANLIARLNDEFEFRVVTRDTDYTGTTPYPGIQSDSWNTLPDGTYVYYFSEKKLNRKNISTLIAETPHDVIYLNGVYSLYFTLIPLLILRKRPGTKVIIAARGMLAESAINVKKTKKKAFLLLSRLRGIFKEVTFHASTEQEKKDIEREFGTSVVVAVAGNLASKTIPGSNPIRPKKQGSVSLVSIARISPEKNLLYGLGILTQLSRQGTSGAEIRFDIYGPVYNEKYWEECKLLIRGFPARIKVNYKGSLESERVLETLTGYHFLFMPTQGENFGHIILQALSAGCPVIISDRTPWRELEGKFAGWDLPLGNEPGFVKAIGEALEMNQEAYNRFSDSSFRYAKQWLLESGSENANRLLFRA